MTTPHFPIANLDQDDINNIEALNDESDTYQMQDCEDNEGNQSSTAGFHKIEFNTLPAGKDSNISNSKMQDSDIMRHVIALCHELIRIVFVPLLLYLLVAGCLCCVMFRDALGSQGLYIVLLLVGIGFMIPVFKTIRKIRTEQADDHVMSKNGSLSYMFAVNNPNLSLSNSISTTDSHKSLPFQYTFFMTLILTLILSFFLGDYLYYTYYKPFDDYRHLRYIETPINPLKESGSRYLDAGVVNFSADSYVDRARGGCYRGGGRTYCLAPIVQGENGNSKDEGVGAGVDKEGVVKDIPTSAIGSYDYFAVGVDCCSCPGPSDFSCGDFAFSNDQAGLRILNTSDRAGYLFALDQWAARLLNSAPTKNPLFFRWSNKPFEKIQDLQDAQFSSFVGILLFVFLGLLVLGCAGYGLRMLVASEKQRQIRSGTNSGQYGSVAQ